MAVADAALAPRRPWWSRLPSSWLQMSPPDDRERLDETDYRRRREDYAPPPAPRIQVPIGVVVTIAIYLIGQLAGSIWWAATLSSKVAYLEQRQGELWQKLEANDLARSKLDSGLDERIRGKIRETMDDWGYLRVRPRKEE